jgi:predicted transposase YbfD/YdcC
MCKVRWCVNNERHLFGRMVVFSNQLPERCPMQSTIHPFALPLPAAVPFAISIHALAAQLTQVVDQRHPRGVRYPLAPLLTIAILAKLAGHSRLEALADWARLRAAPLAQLFGLRRPTMPHARTWGRILAHAVDPTALATLLGQVFHPPHQPGVIPARGSVVLAVDGKTLRGTIPLGQTQGVHLVAVYLPAQGVTLAQIAVDQKTNEITVVPILLTQVDLSGVVVTGDAMQCQQALSRQIVAAGGDYLWSVKDNQPTLLADIQQVFRPSTPLPGWSDPAPDWQTARTVEAGHGRIEERGITVSSMLTDYTPWPGLAQVFRLERTVTDGLGRQRREIAYGVTSLPASSAPPDRLLAIARAHWGIENGLHYRRDVSLQEDASLLRRGHGPAVLAALNNAVIGLIRQHNEPNLAAVQRRFLYQWDQLLHGLQRE